jgi:hypothetical protein
MYNQIWSPLKQEFVPTLSKHGRQALKMYVNSFMTGGAVMTEQDFIKGLNAAEDKNKYIKTNISKDATKYGNKGGEARNNINYKELYTSLGDIQNILTITSKSKRVPIFISNLKKGNEENTTTGDEAISTVTDTSTQVVQVETKEAPIAGKVEALTDGVGEKGAATSPEGGQDIDPQKLKNIAAAATQTSEHIKNAITNPLTNTSMGDIKNELKTVVGAIEGVGEVVEEVVEEEVVEEEE